MAPSPIDQHEGIFGYAEPASGLQLIVAIHSTRLGPAVGGTRFWSYDNTDEALADAKRLSRAMSYKCALAGLPAGGGKAVIMAQDGGPTPALIDAYGRFLNRIGDLFATGEDVGFSVEACERLKAITPFVAGTISSGHGNPATHTADGVFYALKAAVLHTWRAGSLAGLKVAVQGLGGVGIRLCERLHAEGAELTVADVRPALVQAAADRFAARVVSATTIHSETVDVWAPCALGDGITAQSVSEIGARVIVGAANNQLSDPGLAETLQARGILWAPDFLVNAGGILSAYDEVSQIPGRIPTSLVPLDDRLRAIGVRLLMVIEHAQVAASTPMAAALKIAQDRLSGTSEI